MGLRPGRRSVRLEYEEVDLAHHGGAGTLRVVHNYGETQHRGLVRVNKMLAIDKVLRSAHLKTAMQGMAAAGSR